MCGICGFVLRPGAEAPSAGVIDAMNETILHRGPDATGIWRRNEVVFGHRRLSIVDLTHGGQPMVRGRTAICFNGEIYNHLELRASIAAEGASWEGHSDTETLLECLARDPAETLRRARGMYAFAYWDGASLLLARDPLGIKPLYYAETPRGLVFGSEIKALLPFPGLSREIDPLAVEDYFALGYISAPKSIFRSVRKLPPGHLLRWRDGTVRLEAFWDLPAPPDDQTIPADAEERILEALEESVRAHLMSDVPLGAFLSGGVDSSAVVWAASRHHPRLHTCGIAFEEAEADESPYAREVARLFGTDHRSKTTRAEEAADLDLLSWHYDEPFGDSSALPTFHVCRMARESLTVCLSGDGGDENFLGYRRYRFEQSENRVRGLLPAPLRRLVFGALGAIYPKFDWLPRPFRAKTTFQNLARDPVAGYFNSMQKIRDRARLFSGDLKRSLGGYTALEVFAHHYARAPGRRAIDKTQYLDFKTYLVDDILTKVDRASMAVSLEVRVPLVDVRFVEAAMRLPSSGKLRGGEGKHLFKKALTRVLPREILYRPKQGFSIPLARWLRSGLKERFGDLLAGTHDLLDGAEVRRLWDAHQSGLCDHSAELWLLGCFRLWERRFAWAGG